LSEEGRIRERVVKVVKLIPEKIKEDYTAVGLLALGGCGLALAYFMGWLKLPAKEEPKPSISPSNPPSSLPPPSDAEPPAEPAFCEVEVMTTYPYPHVYSKYREDYGSSAIRTTQLWGTQLWFAVPTSCVDWFGGEYRFKEARVTRGKAWVYTFIKPDGFVDLIIYPYADLVSVEAVHEHI